MELLKTLCTIHAPSGSEHALKEFIIKYIQKESPKWDAKPEIYAGEDLMDNVIVVFGTPRTAIFAHMDSVGFTVRYENQLIPIGSPEVEEGYILTGLDNLGPIECEIVSDDKDRTFYKFGRAIERGSTLTYKADFRETGDYVQCCYLDNRLGIYNALKVCEGIKHGIVVFSTFEEHGGGSVPLLMRYIYDRWPIKNALISDITWVTDGVRPGEGVAISMRDRNIPRQSFIRKIINIADKHKVKYQLEVEAGGSSDGREVHQSPYPVDWCFIGAPEQNVHSPNEKVHKQDIDSMINLYKILMQEL